MRDMSETCAHISTGKMCEFGVQWDEGKPLFLLQQMSSVNMCHPICCRRTTVAHPCHLDKSLSRFPTYTMSHAVSGKGNRGRMGLRAMHSNTCTRRWHSKGSSEYKIWKKIQSLSNTKRPVMIDSNSIPIIIFNLYESCNDSTSVKGPVTIECHLLWACLTLDLTHDDYRITSTLSHHLNTIASPQHMMTIASSVTSMCHSGISVRTYIGMIHRYDTYHDASLWYRMAIDLELLERKTIEKRVRCCACCFAVMEDIWNQKPTREGPKCWLAPAPPVSHPHSRQLPTAHLYHIA